VPNLRVRACALRGPCKRAPRKRASLLRGPRKRGPGGLTGMGGKRPGDGSKASPLSPPSAFCGEQVLGDLTQVLGHLTQVLGHLTQVLGHLTVAADWPHFVTCRTMMAADMWH
jgi:hypothetical protein